MPKVKKQQTDTNVQHARRNIMLGSAAVIAQPFIPTAALANTAPPGTTSSIRPSPLVASVAQAFQTTSPSNVSVLVAQAADYLDRAIRFGRLDVSNFNFTKARWNEGRNLHDAMRAAMAAEGITMTRTVVIDGETFSFPMGTKSLPTIEQFIADEMDIFYRTNNAHLTHERVRRDSAMDTGRIVLAKLLSLFGIRDVSAAFFELLEAEGFLDPKFWKKGNIPQSIDVLIKRITSSAFFKKLVEKVGKKVAIKVIGEITGRFVPGIGQAIMIGSLIWIAYEQISSRIEDVKVSPPPVA